MLPILYQDEWFFAVDKPSGLAVHRGWSQDRVVMTDLLLEQMARSTLHPLGRLDRGTSGVVLFADDGEKVEPLNEALRQVGAHRKYLALVRGVPPPCGTIDHPIPRRVGGPRVDSVTTYRLIASCPTQPRTVSLVEAIPKTGRLHQVRRHLKHLGHPVIGDSKYGRPDLNRPLSEHYGIARMALHAFQVCLVSPHLGRKVSICSALPEDLVTPLLRMGFDPMCWEGGVDSSSAID